MLQVVKTMYERILNRLAAPLLLDETKFKDIHDNLILPLTLGETPSGIAKVTHEATSEAGKIKVINVKGTLTSGNAAGDSGTRSYTTIARDIKTAIADGYRSIAFNFSTYGGESDGAMGLAKFINSLPALYGAKTIAIIDGPCCSAGYLLASNTQEILCTAGAELGSIGVIASIPNRVSGDEKTGTTWTILRSHSEKALGNPHEPISDAALASIQKKVDNLAKVMIDTIVTGRPKLSKDIIATLNGKTVLGDEAISLGLADGLIESVDITLEMLNRRCKNMSSSFDNSSAQVDETMRLRAELEAVKAASSVAISKAVADERARCLAILDAAKTFGLSSDVAIKQINLSSSIEQSVAMFEAVKEAIQMANPTPVAATATPQVAESASSPFAEWIKGNEFLASIK